MNYNPELNVYVAWFAGLCVAFSCLRIWVIWLNWPDNKSKKDDE